jgi:hypothetical protein
MITGPNGGGVKKPVVKAVAKPATKPLTKVGVKNTVKKSTNIPVWLQQPTYYAFTQAWRAEGGGGLISAATYKKMTPQQRAWADKFNMEYKKYTK